MAKYEERDFKFTIPNFRELSGQNPSLVMDIEEALPKIGAFHLRCDLANNTELVVIRNDELTPERVQEELEKFGLSVTGFERVNE